jgi:hypothetical protein
MLFRKDIEPACAYCQHSSPVDDESVICSKKGIMQPWSRCRKFNYDPLKRVPEFQPKPSTKGIDPSSFDI